jgi:hypothetical protein
MIKLDLNKIKQKDIQEREYQNKAGDTVKVRELELETKTLKEVKEVTKSKDGQKVLVKTGFVALKSVKNEDGTWTNGDIVGDVMEWRDTKATFSEKETSFYQALDKSNEEMKAKFAKDQPWGTIREEAQKMVDSIPF